MKNIYIYTIVLFFFLPTMTGQRVVSLEDIHAAVIQNSYLSKSAKIQREIVDQGFKFYKSQLKPSLTFGGSLPNFSKSSAPVIQPDGSISFQSIRQSSSVLSLSATQVISATGGALFLTSDLQRFDNYDSNFKQYNGSPIRLGISQPLFGFNPWKYRKQIQPLLVEEASRTYNIQIEETLGNATNLYFDILIAKQNLDIANTNEEVNQKLLNITEERLRLGKVSLDEKLQLEIELNNARLSVSQATFQLQDAIAALYTLLGQSNVPSELSFSIPEKNNTKEIDISALLSSYKKNRPEILAYRRSLTQADQDIAQAKANFGFQASLDASIGLTRGSETLNEIYTNPFDEQQFNVSVNVPILDWGKKKAAVQQIKLQKDEIKASYDQQLIELKNAIKQRGFFFSRLQNELVILLDIMEKAQERFTISNERYILGNIDITNLTLAQREKDQTKRNYINALKSYWSTYYQLRALSGYDILENKSINYN